MPVLPQLNLNPGGTDALPISSWDRRMVEVLAADQEVHSRLLDTAKRIQELLTTGECGELVETAEIYGSLQLDKGRLSEIETTRSWQQTWPSHYANERSDVDVVCVMKPGVCANDIKELLERERRPEDPCWLLIGEVQVHKFRSTQYTFLGTVGDDGDDDDGDYGEEDDREEVPEVYLDITCIESKDHFKFFKNRQDAFREAFDSGRKKMEMRFHQAGVVAFDAYIHLLKAFAAKVPGNALTGFQSVCIGLFTLHIGYFRLKTSQSIALSLFESFLHFCYSFYSDVTRPQNISWLDYRYCAMDLSSSGKWIPRVSRCWPSELYFMQAEAQLVLASYAHTASIHSLPTTAPPTSASSTCCSCSSTVGDPDSPRSSSTSGPWTPGWKGPSPPASSPPG
eukprot:gnl/TRDRNA2_/TRDRNA2_125922_c0_seq1.p1 gnl/TRDRNA2_/TRDRNA2_125922_c0~~gnl/TRDRNA2_/TRDRNA2_125922_c0_seq1.p1  ORF type:complete len:396 (+),score=68.65 gnl/TRDRNA2_/TRDRNA2_125922_c0_seq1:113-1300(+)